MTPQEQIDHLTAQLIELSANFVELKKRVTELENDVHFTNYKYDAPYAGAGVDSAVGEVV